MTSSGKYGRIPPELNSKDDEGNQVFRDDFRELPVAVRQYDVKRALVPEPVSGNGSIETRTHRYMP